MKMSRVGIIGGGPGGLMTAYSLQKCASGPFQITLFEGSDRLGGKIMTPTFSHAPVRFEAGAAEFYDYSAFDDDPLKDLIAELGLSISPMAGSAVIMNEKILSNLDDIREHLGMDACQELAHFDRQAKDLMTPQEFYGSDYPDGADQKDIVKERFDSLLGTVSNPVARQYIEHLIHSDLATEPHRTSPAYGLQNYLMNHHDYMSLYGIQGGNEQLPMELASRMDATIRFRHCVKKVVKTDHHSILVHSDHAGEAKVDEFDYVVIALPHNQINSVAFEGSRLEHAVKQHHDYYHHPAHYLRMTILFRTPFWRTSLNDSFWMLDQFGGCCLYDESSREPGNDYGVLGWLLAGEAAEEMSTMDDARLIDAALDSLPSFLTEGRDQFLEGRVCRWLGAVNAMPGGVLPQSLDRRHQPEPVEHPNLFFVGDYLFDSTLNGVLDSATFVAEWLASNITETMKCPHDRTRGKPY